MKTVLVTGAGGGLGKAIALLFHDKGWQVIATMRDTAKAADMAGMERMKLLPLDITDKSQIDRAAVAAGCWGDIDVLVNNAAYGLVGPLEGVADEQLLKVINTNLLGAIRMTQAFVPKFRQRKSGTIVNITSIAGLITIPFDCLYHTVKWGLEGFTEALSYELAPFGVSVKAVAPGAIRTNFGANMVFVAAEPYKEAMDNFIKTATAHMDPSVATSAEDVAAVVFAAATDGKDHVHYTVGADAIAKAQRRMEVGPEVFRKEMEREYLG